MDFYREFFVKGFTFSGCSSRGDFWKTYGVNVCAMFLLLTLTAANENFIFLYMLFALATSIPTLAITVRRLHDVGKSGWSLLLYMVPFIGAFIVLYYLLQPSMEHNNPYADPNNFHSNSGNSYHSYSQSSRSSGGKQSRSQNNNWAYQAPAHEVHQHIVNAVGDQGEVDNKFNQASLLLTSGKYNECIKAYMTLAAQHPDRKGDCAGQIGAAMYFLGDYKNAVKYYKVAKKYGADAESMDYNIQEAKEAYYKTAG